MKLILVLLISLSSFPSMADLTTPTGEVILEIYGAIEKTNNDDVAEFDQTMINQLSKRVIHTNNHVVKDVVPYEGVDLSTLLKQLGAKGSIARVFALDDYVAEISIAEIHKYKVILATKENGKNLTIEDKGPFFVVFPFNDYPELRDNTHYSQSVWQVKSIEIE